MNHPLSFRLYGAPVVLTVPGIDNSGPGHWQTIWESQRNDTHRVELGMWNTPHRNSWVTRLSQAIRGSQVADLPTGARVLGFNYDTGERYLSVPDFLPTPDA